MEVSYLVMENVEEYSIINCVYTYKSVPLATFSSKQQAINYIYKYSKPKQAYYPPASPLDYGKLELKKIVHNPTTPANKLSNYEHANDLYY